VGNNKDAIPLMRGAKGARWNAVPFSIVPALGQVSENSAKPPNKETWYVLHEDEEGSYFANESGVLSPEPATFAVDAGAESRNG
jgi:hypothetical protein